MTSLEAANQIKASGDAKPCGEPSAASAIASSTASLASRERTFIMDITPTPEFLEACRRILGGDDPATVLGAMMDGDPRMDYVRALHADLVEQKREGKPSIIHRRAMTMRRLKASITME